MEIPIEIFITGMGVSISLAIFGFIRNPQIPAMLVFGGMFILSFAVMTDTIILDSFSFLSSDSILYAYNVESATGNVNLNNGGTTARTEFVSTSASQLTGDTINCIDSYFGKTLSPTGNVNFGIFDTAGTLVTSFGVTDLSTISSAQDWHTECLTGENTYTIQSGDRIGIQYLGGNATTFISQRSDGNNPFDGTVTFLSSWTAGAWVSSTTNDVTMRYYLTESGVTINTNTTYEFTELPKVLFALIGVIMMLCGAIMVGRN